MIKKLTKQSILLVAVLFTLCFGAFANSDTKVPQETKNFRITIEGKVRSGEIYFQGIANVFEEVRHSSSTQNLVLTVLADPSGKYRVRFNIVNYIKFPDEKSNESINIQSGYFVDMGVKKLVYKSSDSELNITVEEEK